jgi:RimJ/RimL family protein N-acetyltransferase
MTHARLWIEDQIRIREPANWVIEVGGHASGAIGLEPRDDVNRIAAEIGFWLGQELWGRGIMTEAVGAVTRYGFRELGYERIFAEIFAWNPASMRVLEKNGYTREGVLRRSAYKAGKIVDQMVWAALSTD